MPEVETEVVRESGQWSVYLVVLSSGGTERRLVGTHVTQERALRSADLIRRAAARRRPRREDPHE